MSSTIVEGWKLVPVVGWSIIHMVNRSEAEIQRRIMEYGFIPSKWREEKYRLVTFCCIHGSDAHLLANIGAYLSVIQGFSLHRSCSGVINAFAAGIIFLTSSVGALPFVWFKNLHDLRQYQDQYAGSISLLRSVVKQLHNLKTDRFTAHCGASAGICGLAGFQVMTSPHYIPALTTSAACVFSLIKSCWRKEPSEMSDVAHFGGLVTGAALGLCWRGYEAHRNRKRIAGGRILGSAPSTVHVLSTAVFTATVVLLLLC